MISVAESEESWKDCEASEFEIETESNVKSDMIVNSEKDKNDNHGRDTFAERFLEEIDSLRSKSKKSMKSLRDLKYNTREAELRKDKRLSVLENVVESLYLACVGQSFKNEREPMNMALRRYNGRNEVAIGTISNANRGNGNERNSQTTNNTESVKGPGICVRKVPYFFTPIAIKTQLAEVLGAKFNQTREVMLERIHEVSRLKYYNHEIGELKESMTIKLILDIELDDYIMRQGVLELEDIIFKKIQRYVPLEIYCSRKRLRGF